MLPAKPVIASATLSCTPVSVRRNCLRFIRAAILRSMTESLKVGLAGLRSDGASSCSHLDCSFKRSPNGLASGIRIARGFRSEATLHRGSGLNVNKLASCDSRFGRLRTGKRRAEGSPHPSPCSCGWLRNVRMPRRTACRLAGKGTKHRHAPRSRCEGLEGPDGFAPAKVSNALSSTDGGSIPREPEVVRVSLPDATSHQSGRATANHGNRSATLSRARRAIRLGRSSLRKRQRFGPGKSRVV
jgi:hypothetical protein